MEFFGILKNKNEDKIEKICRESGDVAKLVEIFNKKWIDVNTLEFVSTHTLSISRLEH